MGIFERYLSVWVGLAILFGVMLGAVVPNLFAVVAGLEFAHVNLVIAVLIWLMIYPMMVQIDFASLKDVGKKPKGLLLTLTINWLVKPFTMALLGWLFFKVFFANLVDAQSANEYIAGMILLGVAPCTAMVFVWSQMTKGDPNYTLVQVSINDIIMVFAFAPLTALLLGVNDISIPWETLLLSVGLYVLLPLVAGAVTRVMLQKGTQDDDSNSLDNSNNPHNNSNNANNAIAKNANNAIENFCNRLKPFSIIGLLATVFILFGLQAQTILAKPLVIVLIAIPLLIQTYGIFAMSYFVAKLLKLPHNISAPASMIATSNFFELAVAVAISLFGLNSGAGLATVVGVLVEVPVMLSLVWFANRTRGWFG